MLQELELVQTISKAIRNKDISYIYRLVDRLIISFRGASQTNYFYEIIYLYQLLSNRCDLELQTSILISSLTNQLGISSKATIIDKRIELYNLLLTLDTRARTNSTYDISSKTFSRLILNIESSRILKNIFGNFRVEYTIYNIPKDTSIGIIQYTISLQNDRLSKIKNSRNSTLLDNIQIDRINILLSGVAIFNKKNSNFARGITTIIAPDQVDNEDEVELEDNSEFSKARAKDRDQYFIDAATYTRGNDDIEDVRGDIDQDNEDSNKLGNSLDSGL